MNKRRNLFFVFALIALGCVILSSCNDLWGVQQTTAISFKVNLEEILNSDAARFTQRLKGFSRSATYNTTSNDFTYKFVVTASLHDASNGSIIDSKYQEINESEFKDFDSIDDIEFMFNEIRVGRSIYATIEIAGVGKRTIYS